MKAKLFAIANLNDTNKNITNGIAYQEGVRRGKSAAYSALKKAEREFARAVQAGNLKKAGQMARLVKTLKEEINA
jgi:hypothetical protein